MCDPISLGLGLTDLLGVGAATAAETAPVLAEAAPIAAEAGATDVLAAGAGDVLAGSELGALDAGVTAADLAGGVAGADVAVGPIAAADIAGGTTAAADIAGPAAFDALGFANVADTGAGLTAAPANLGALTTAASNPAVLGGAVPPTLGGGANLAGGVIPAGAAEALPGSALDVTQVSGANLASLTDPSVMTDVPVEDAGWAPQANTDVLGTAGTPPTDNIPLPQPRPPTAPGGDVTSDLASTTPGLSGGGVGGGGQGTPPPPSPPPPKDGGGGFDWWKAAGLGLAAAPLAITLGRGESQMPQQGQQSQALSTATGAAGTQLLNQAMAGQVTPGQQATLTFNRQAMINQARQQLFNQGIQNPEASSAWGGIVANIDNQIAQQQQQFLTANIDEAFKGTGQAQQNLTALAGQQINLDTAYQQAIANAGRSLGSVVGQAGTRLL